ncbi:heterokaryon incompatibility protein-domain-containing protein [Diaporthe sp. PMI_573]|nr:heterokaryon incompatibility protein-domain-containing protein [Diaporthaceae sp. PMI_573]
MSYTWGGPKDQVPLRVGGQTVSIPKNLENALKRLRHLDRRRYVWADAVCINQADLSERGRQVSIMRHIYTKARRVLVWLGQDKANYAKLAFSTICEIVRSWRPPNNPNRFSSYKDAFEPQKDGLSIDEDGWTALQALFQTDYFTRFWVIQELVLGQNATVVWGGHTISWGLVGISAAWLLTRGWATNPDWPISAAYNAFLIYVLPLARRSAISSFSKLDLSAVLAMTMGRFKSKDARDRIFALLGMPFSGNDPEKDQLVTPDYTADVQSVYLGATKRMLSQDANLRLLSAVQHGLEIDGTSPSWVPKWDQSLSAEPLALRQEHGYYANAGELFTPGDDTFGADGKSLTLTGLKVTSVTHATDPFTAGKISFSSLPDKLRDAMLIMLSYLNDPDRQVRSSWSETMEKFTIPGLNHPEKQAEVLSSDGGFLMSATTGTPGKYGMRESTEILDGEKMGIDNLGEFLMYWRERCTWDADALRHEDFKDFWAAVEEEESTYATERAMCSMNAFLGRKVFRCEDGKLGLGPAAMRSGDVLVVLFGGIVPYVLRPLDSATDDGDEQKWAFVGECIVPTIMQGQAVEEAGLLADGTYAREKDGTLRLDPVAQDPRFHREVGMNGVQRFEIR